jgi:hypothetical protein
MSQQSARKLHEKVCGNCIIFNSNCPLPDVTGFNKRSEAHAAALANLNITHLVLNKYTRSYIDFEILCDFSTILGDDL